MTMLMDKHDDRDDHVWIRAIEPIQYNRRRTMPGGLLAVHRDTAADLISRGAASDEALDPGGDAASDESAGPGGDAGDGTRAATLAAAIDQLVPGDPDHWTGQGKPEIKALAALSGLKDIRAAERDGVWAACQARSQPDGAT